jgi:hypothetical protein
MPQYVQSLLGISGDFYVQRNHTYENTVSEERAKEEGRFSDKAHYHNYGVEKMERALLAIEHPIMTIVAPRTNDGNPTVIMLLDEFGNNDAPMYAVLSFYSNKPVNGKFDFRPHVVLTIAEREWLAEKGRTGYDEIIKSAVEDNRVIDYDKSKRDDLSVIAQTTSLGNITTSSLEHNLSQFKKEINTFKQKNKISYQSRSDADYLSAVKRGDMETAQRMVDEAAKAAGYDTPMLYHGTKNFGFTQFDLNKMDDKMSIFLTSTPETASTYSGVTGKRGISEKYFNKNLFDMSAKELVKTANQFINEREKGRDIEYRYYTKNDLLKMADEVQDGLSRLKDVGKEVSHEYANKAMRDFDDSALRVHTIINNMLEDIKNGESYNWIGAAINQLANETDEFNTPEFKKLSDTLFVLGEIQDSGILRAGEEEAILRVRPDLLYYEYESNVRVAHELQKKMRKGVE